MIKKKTFEPSPFYLTLSENNYIQEPDFEIDYTLLFKKNITDEYNKKYKNIEEDEVEDDLIDMIIDSKKESYFKNQFFFPNSKFIKYINTLDSSDEESDEESEELSRLGYDLDHFYSDYDCSRNLEAEYGDTDSEEDEEYKNEYIDFLSNL